MSAARTWVKRVAFRDVVSLREPSRTTLVERWLFNRAAIELRPGAVFRFQGGEHQAINVRRNWAARMLARLRPPLDARLPGLPS